MGINASYSGGDRQARTGREINGKYSVRLCSYSTYITSKSRRLIVCNATFAYCRACGGQEYAEAYLGLRS